MKRTRQRCLPWWDEQENRKRVERDQVAIDIIIIRTGSGPVSITLDVAQVPPAAHVTQTRSTPVYGPSKAIVDCASDKTNPMS